jgi:hypothetical protein
MGTAVVYMSLKNIENICEEHCKPFHPDVSEFTSVFDYELCLNDCKELYSILKDLVSIIVKRCEKDVQRDEKVLKGCIGYYINMLISRKSLVEDVLKIIANEMNVKID